jgi:hypothetical protein
MAHERHHQAREGTAMAAVSTVRVIFIREGRAIAWC